LKWQSLTKARREQAGFSFLDQAAAVSAKHCDCAQVQRQRLSSTSSSAVHVRIRRKCDAIVDTAVQRAGARNFLAVPKLKNFFLNLF
jgi:hypothetical protein